MNWNAPFDASDLEELDARLLSKADRVVPMRDIAKGDTGPRVIGMRHDVDAASGHALHAFETALSMAEWEFDHGYSSTYFLRHDAPYWNADNLVRALAFEELGHEVGIHVNAIAHALRVRRSPDWILLEALGDLRSVGLRVDGFQYHGDELCYMNPDSMCGDVRFVNDEMFTECARPGIGAPDRVVEWKGTQVQLEPRPMSDYHLSYQAASLPKADYLSDSGGRWSQPFDDVVDRFGAGQLHLLVHPDWWELAFVGARV